MVLTPCRSSSHSLSVRILTAFLTRAEVLLGHLFLAGHRELLEIPAVWWRRLVTMLLGFALGFVISF